MNKASWVLSLLVVGLLAGCDGAGSGKSAVRNAAVSLHQLYNQGQFQKILEAADPKYQSAFPRAKHDALMSAIQGRLGNYRSTSKELWHFQKATSEITAVGTLESEFEKGQGTEHFVFAIRGTNVTLVMYDIESEALRRK